MECKGRWYFPMSVKLKYWNISRMECKEIRAKEQAKVKKDWNISRMECKGQLSFYNF